MNPETPLADSGPATTGVLASFLPRERLARLSAPTPLARPWAERVEGAVLFVDVSGFTRLTERLSLQGAIGSEQLSRVIDRCFGRLTERVTELGGDVIAYAGDAMLAMWPASSSDGLETATCLAAQAALRAQNDGAIDGGDVGERLRLRASVACGPLLLLEVGGDAGRWEYLVSGAPLADVFAADERARPGEVVLSPAAARILGHRCVGSAISDEFLLLRGIPAPLPAPETETAPTASAPISAEGLASMRACVPDFLATRLEAGHSDWLAEFRTLSVVFINLRDRIVDDVASAPRLQSAFAAMQRAVERCEGSVYQALVDDKGVSMVAAFGLPSQAHESDAARAVRCAVSAHRDLVEQGFANSIGIATGLAFTGIYGTPTRRQYTLVGAVVNRGARLAQAAQNDVLCDEATRTAASRRDRTSFAPRPPLQLKGIAEPVPAWSPLGKGGATADGEAAEPRTRAVIGRREERSRLDAALDGLQAARSGGLAAVSGGGLVMIEGEAGIGKSRLVTYALDRAAEAGIDRLVGGGQQVEHLAVYHAWRPVFEELLAIDAAEPDSAALADAVRARFADDPDLHDLVPLLSAVLPFDIPDSERTSAMPAEARADTTRALLVRLLRDASEAGPTVLVAEDVHWFDSASLTLLSTVVERAPGLLVIASARSEDAETPALRRRMSESEGVCRIELGAMQEPESAALVCNCLGVDMVPAEVTAVIHRRGQGNPFFTEQLALALRDYGLVRIANDGCSVAPEAADLNRSLDEQLSRRGLPGTLQGVVGGRVDRLAPGPQLAVKLASVIGPRFETDALASVYPDRVDSSELEAWLDELVRLRIAIPDHSEPEAAFAFRHAILRDVVYNSLTFGQRRSTHTAVAEWLERDGRGAEARNYPVLAHHWARAGVGGKATGYLAGAGDDALERYANEEAVRFFEEAIAIDDEAAGGLGTPDEARAGWELQLGAAYVNWSRYAEARKHLGAGLALKGHRAPGSPVSDGFGLTGQMARQAVHRLWSDRFVGRRRDTAAELQRVARAYESLVEAFYLDNAPLPCLLSAVRSLNLAELGGPSPELARGYASFGAILGFVPAHRAAEKYFERAIRTAEETDEASARAWVGLAAGVYLIGVGSWEEAARHLTETRDVSERLGDRRRWDDAMQNLAALDFLQGRYGTSLGQAVALHDSATERKDDRGLTVALRRRALCLLATNDLGDMATCVDRLHGFAEGKGDLYRDLPPLALKAQHCLREGRHREAFEATEQAQAIMKKATPTFFDSLTDFANVAEVVLSLQKITAEREIVGVPDLRSRSRDACKSLRRFARVFPIGRPYALLWNGVRLHAEGRQRRAAASWTESIAASGELGIEHCEGSARLELGRHLLADGTGGREQLAMAAEIFERLGARHDHDQARTSLQHV